MKLPKKLIDLEMGYEHYPRFVEVIVRDCANLPLNSAKNYKSDKMRQEVLIMVGVAILARYGLTAEIPTQAKRKKA